MAIRWEKKEHIAYLTLHSSWEGNLIDAATLSQLADACEAIEVDNDVRVVILWSAGPDFSLGWDWKQMEEGVLSLPLTHAFDVLADLPRPVVCAVDGRCFSAGLELALACDVRVCSQGARFAFPEMMWGLVPLGGGIQRLARAVGRSWATYLLFTGAEVDAQQALAMGLVSQVAYEGETALSVAEVLARLIAEKGPIAVRYAKEAVQKGMEMPLGQALGLEADLTIILQTTADRAEGVRAFLEKRPPRFTGS